MNPIRWTLATAAAVFVVMLLFSPARALRYARVVVLSFTATLMVIPFVWLICSAFKSTDVLMEYTFLPPMKSWFGETARRDDALVPMTELSEQEQEAARVEKSVVKPTLGFDNFRTLFGEEQTVQGPVTFWRYIGNSVFLATTGTFLSLVFSSMGGYALAKYKRFGGKTPIATFMLASMAIPGLALLAPAFEVIYRLGWMDTYKALLIPGCVSVFGIFLFRQAIMTVPDDLIEAGRIDGCGEFRIYLTLVMPLVRPMVGAFILLSFLGSWNSFIGPNIFLQSQGKLTLPVVLNQYITTYRQQYGVFLAGTLLAIIPPAALFIALQREFISGLTSGALKQ